MNPERNKKMNDKFKLDLIYGGWGLSKIVHKISFYDDLSKAIFEYHHKRRYAIKLYYDLLPVVMHPDRAVDWCFDEDEKQDLEELWR